MKLTVINKKTKQKQHIIATNITQFYIDKKHKECLRIELPNGQFQNFVKNDHDFILGHGGNIVK